jgi:hypothetical protein
MKKIISAVILVVFVAVISVSCGASKVCPAYSSDQPTEQTGQQNS